MNSKNNRLNGSNHCRQVPLLAVVGVLLWAVPDAEANWQFSPELATGVTYDDNPRLVDTSGSPEEIEYGFDVRAIFFYDTELTDVTITPRLRSLSYTEDDNLNTDDQFLRFDLRHDRQRFNFRFRADYSSESVRTAERSDVDFDIEDPADIPNDDTGGVFLAGKREDLTLTPEFAYDLSQRFALRINGKLLDTSYDDQASLFLAGYLDYTIGASLAYELSEQDTISFTFEGGNYEADTAQFSPDSKSGIVGIGYEREVSERTQLRMGIGTDRSEDQDNEEQSNTVGEISIIHEYLTTKAFASYQRTVSGNGGGNQSLRDAFSVNISRALSPRLTLMGGLRAYSTETLSSLSGGAGERDYLQLRAVASWYMTPKISFDFSYTYTDNDRKVASGGSVGGDSSRLGVWVTWRPNP